MDIHFSSDIIKPLALIFLAVAGNFAEQTLGCKAQRILTHSMLAKHLVVLTTIFFAIDLTNDNKYTPYVKFQYAIAVFVGFIAVARLDTVFSVLVLTLLFSNYIVIKYILYYNEHDKDHKNLIILKQLNPMLFYFTLVIVIVGVMIYLNKQRFNYKKNWSTFNFIFGKTTCRSLVGGAKE